MRFIVLILLAFTGLMQSAEARSCYMAQEAEAEQGIRIHSELMVIGLNCQHMATANGQNLYTAYRNFTQRHLGLFETYEKILLANFSKTESGRAEDHLNTLRTNFANKISNDAAKMRPDMFCRQYSPRIIKAVEMNKEELRRWAATVFPSHPVSKPICASQLQ